MIATTVREKPILFSSELVRAILDGRKTQTRRIVKMPRTPAGWHWWPERARVDRGFPTDDSGEVLPIEAWRNGSFPAPETYYRNWYLHVPNAHPDDYAKFGADAEVVDRVYSPWTAGDRLWVREAWAATKGWDECPPSRITNGEAIWYYADDSTSSSLLYPAFGRRRPSIHMPRHASRITLEIESVRVERVQDISEDDARAEGVGGMRDMRFATVLGNIASTGYRLNFMDLWNQINGPGAWERNDWVWVLSFRRLA